MDLFFIISLISLGYIVFLYALYFGREKKYYKVYDKPVSIIVPCYNGDGNNLIKCIDSCFKAHGTKEVILIDNNSTSPDTLNAMKFLDKKYPALTLIKETKAGKRFAHMAGIKKAKYDLIVFIDDDTLIDYWAIQELIKPMQDKKIGAVCGNIKILNVDDNFLTKCLDTMYWNSFEFYRQAISGLGILYVCSGALACYRKKALLSLEYEYLNQKFLGKNCNISDDSFMTLRIQSRLGYDVAYQNNAIAYTYSPNTIKEFWKQLFRWRKGFLRESLLLWKEPKHNIKILFTETQLKLILQTVISFSRVYFFIWLLLYFDWHILIIYLMTFIFYEFLLASAQLVSRPSKIIYIFGYSFMYDFFFVFTFLYALIKIRHQGNWSTR